MNSKPIQLESRISFTLLYRDRRGNGSYRTANHANAGPHMSETDLQPTGLQWELRLHHLCTLRNIFQNLRNDVIGGDPFGIGLEVQDQAMTQRRRRHCLDIVEADIETALRKGADFAGENQCLGTAWTAAESQILICNRR